MRIKPMRISLLIIFLFLAVLPSSLLADSDSIELIIKNGQSDVLDFDQAVKRVAIANPDIADATVMSLKQILIVGKSLGSTSMIIWTEEGYTKYKLIIQQDATPKQVMLMVRFMEVNKTALKEFGVDFIINNLKSDGVTYNTGSYGGKVGEPNDPLLLGNTVDMFFSIPTSDFSSILKALFENNLATTLAAPNLSAISGEEAKFLAGGEFPIPIVSGQTGSQTVTIQFKEYGIKLVFRPTVMDSNLVNLKVATEVSQLDFENGVTLSGFQIPSLITRKAESVVELKEGQFLVIGGLLSNEKTKMRSRIPVLGHIPILGYLFSSTRYLNKESELIITLTPKIIQSLSEDEVPELDLDVKKKRKRNK